jgi:hypothetical protein
MSTDATQQLDAAVAAADAADAIDTTADAAKMRAFFASFDQPLLNTPEPEEMRSRIDRLLAKWACLSHWEVEHSKKLIVPALEKTIERCRMHAEKLSPADMQRGLAHSGYSKLREELLSHAQVLEEELPRIQSAACVVAVA